MVIFQFKRAPDGPVSGLYWSKEILQPGCLSAPATDRMIQSARTLILSLALVLLGSTPSFSQTPQAAATAPDKAGAYYNFAMGHLYAELSAAYNNRGEYYQKAIDFSDRVCQLSSTFPRGRSHS